MHHTWWDSILHAWPLTLFVPGVLVVLATLATIVRIVDGDS